MRRMKLPSKEMGVLDVLTIDSTNGVWEPAWDRLRLLEEGALVSRVPPIVIRHALNKWTQPLVSALGISPSGALRKVGAANKQCAIRRTCPFFTLKCEPSHADLPWCFEPSGVEGEARQVLAKAIAYWHEGVWLIVVEAP